MVDSNESDGIVRQINESKVYRFVCAIALIYNILDRKYREDFDLFKGAQTQGNCCASVDVTTCTLFNVEYETKLALCKLHPWFIAVQRGPCIVL